MSIIKNITKLILLYIKPKVCNSCKQDPPSYTNVHTWKPPMCANQKSAAAARRHLFTTPSAMFSPMFHLFLSCKFWRWGRKQKYSTSYPPFSCRYCEKKDSDGKWQTYSNREGDWKFKETSMAGFVVITLVLQHFSWLHWKVVWIFYLKF